MGEGMLVPLIDNINHQNVCIDITMYSRYFLAYKTRSCEKVVVTDYRDYSGVAHSSNAPMKQKTHLNRLEKYFR